MRFVILTFAISWAFWVPQALLARGIIESVWLSDLLASRWNVAPYGPTIAAVLIVLVNRGPLGLADFLWGGLAQRFSPYLLLPAVFLMPALCWLALYLTPQVGSALAIPVASIPAVAVSMALTSGPLQEEFGWRGFAQPRAQGRMPGVVAAATVGVVWALWHLPLHFATGDEGPQYSAAIAMLVGNIVNMVFLAILIGWLYNATRGSVLAAMLMHASHNIAAFVLFPVFATPEALPFYTLIMALAAVVAVLVGGPGRLGRQRS